MAPRPRKNLADIGFVFLFLFSSTGGESLLVFLAERSRLSLLVVRPYYGLVDRSNSVGDGWKSCEPKDCSPDTLV